MDVNRLWKHQLDALNISINNNFASGTHAHATGTGKSFLGHFLVRSYADKHPNKIIIWICEHKSIISEIFGKCNSRNGLLVCDLVKNKIPNWYECVKSAQVWGKPVLIIVNRAYLVSENRYKKIKSEIGLIIHDECHCGIGNTTQLFYNWILEKYPDTRVIGLSATPPSKDTTPHPMLSNILSRFSIYDATSLGIIVPLKIYWCENYYIDDVGKAILIKNIAIQESICKIIVWCGTIEHCYNTADLWSNIFDNWLVAVDTSQDRSGYLGYNKFYTCSRRGILFCAAKHREGSDIPSLGMGVFLDGVETRGSSVFVQCAGRVLRKSTYKKYGIIVDLKAKDGMLLCDRVGEYLDLKNLTMPWDYKSTVINTIPINSLLLNTNKHQVLTNCYQPKDIDLRSLFIRDLPDNNEYINRFDREINLIVRKGLVTHLFRAMEVLKLVPDDVPHVTRGSCGSSLICYLLGISHIDPIQHNICFARFLNENRETMPDIDFDFPYNRRADIFLKMAIRWSGTIARISNHVHYHEKSALREAIRIWGHKGIIHVSEMDSFMKSLNLNDYNKINKIAKDLEGNFNHYSLHCGGVVYYPDGIPEEDLLEKRRCRLLPQVVCDKRDIAGIGKFKIDILSSRGLAQLVDAYGSSDIDISNPPFTLKMQELFENGYNIGLTLAESSLIRMQFKDIKPKNVEQVAQCLALIRPAAKKSSFGVIYDDDAIRIISKYVNCSEDDADYYRRKMSKDKKKVVDIISKKIGDEKAKYIFDNLSSLSYYGFCKSHSMSYAQLVCWLSWCKIERPIQFWKATLKHCHTSYRRWVHYWEAYKSGVNPFSVNIMKNSESVYSFERNRKFFNYSIFDQLKIYNYWDVREGFIHGCYIKKDDNDIIKFKGIIASHRRLSKTKLALCFGTQDKYMEIVCTCYGFKSKSRIAEGIIFKNGESKIKYL